MLCMVDTCKLDRAAGLRDRAVILIGFFACLHPSEIRLIDVEHLRFHPDGVDLHVLDRTCRNRMQARVTTLSRSALITHCPVAVLESWMGLRRAEDGPLFLRLRRGAQPTPNPDDGRLSIATIRGIIQRAVQRAGGGTKTATFVKPRQRR